MKKQKEKSVDRHIRIDNMSLLEKIDEIMELPEYKSFNKVVNDALFYGLPILEEELFGEGLDEPMTQPAPNNAPYDNCPDNEFCWNVAVLLREINGNVLLNKQMVSMLFQLMSTLLRTNPKYDEIGKLFDSGVLNMIPECLEKEETEMLKKLTALNRKYEENR